MTSVSCDPLHVPPMMQQEGGLVHRLVHVEEPILKIPNLCIHLDREMHYKFAPNKETHM